MGLLLAVSGAIDRLLECVARVAGWLFLVLVALICWDIVTRKLGFQIPGFGSTPIQEMEWHIHGALFLAWLGYGYIRNVHIRIDVFTANLPPRRQAWIEVVGIAIFATPYLIIATWHAYGFALTSYLQNESSDAPNGLPWRWIIKSCLVAGFVLLDLAVISVLCRKLAFLFGAPDVARRAAPAAGGR